jgi:3-deoxy-manno-octulosonate cytidylyltransferase (CMP-KDO synthetase)
METKIIIPARYQSSRFPGKPLVDLAGKSLIQRVWSRCCLALDPSEVFVATDDRRIETHCRRLGIEVIMTSADCLTGTDRVYEASRSLDAELIVNVQGDEPLILPEDILKVIDAHQKEPDLVHCGMCPIVSEDDFRSPSVPKVICRADNRLLYMSRAAIPTDKKLSFQKAFKQVCIYAFTPKALEDFGRSPGKSELEAIEDIEILRFFDLGHEVGMVEVSGASIAVDFPEDVNKVVHAIKESESARRICQ